MEHSLFKLIKSALRKPVGLAIIFFISHSSQAQKTISGFTLLGTYKSHYYYISHRFYLGKDIKRAVSDARSKLDLPGNQVYAAAILNMSENLFIQNAVVTYNISRYGGNGKSDFQNWHDPRNPWIGLTDVKSEGKFVWSNKQPDCEGFTNWNVNEPNNFGTDEDYVQMLIMNPYTLRDGSAVEPMGKWNDWFNQHIANNKKKETKLPVIIEVGPVDCISPAQSNNGSKKQ